MARTLIESLASHFDADQYKDEFRGRLLDLIERKMKGEQRSAKRRNPDAKVVDLMAALQASLDASRARRSGEKDEDPAADGRQSAARKSASKSKDSKDSKAATRRRAA
jgi:DNA end-binding protein Ku